MTMSPIQLFRAGDILLVLLLLFAGYLLFGETNPATAESKTALIQSMKLI